MTQPPPATEPSRVRATPETLAVIERLLAEHGPLMFVQSGGCCDGSSPLCLREGERTHQGVIGLRGRGSEVGVVQQEDAPQPGLEIFFCAVRFRAGK